jgi:hypothetical protein
MCDLMVARLRIVSRDGERLTVATRLPLLPLALRVQVELRQGWCLMRSRAHLVGMAAVPLGAQTRYAHLEGLPWRGGPLLRLLRPLFRRVVGGDIRGIVRTLAARSR